MVLVEKDEFKSLDNYMRIKNFLFIFPLKRSACFFLWFYTIFFGFFVKHTAIKLFEAGFNFSATASYIGFKCILSFISFILCLTSLSDQRAIRGAFGCIYIFNLICYHRFLSTFFTTRQQSIFEFKYFFLDLMNDFFESIEDGLMKYFCYFVFIVTLVLGWHISMVIFSYHRETWIPINPALEGNVADLHILSITAPKPASTGVSNKKKKKANRRRGKQGRRR